MTELPVSSRLSKGMKDRKFGIHLTLIILGSLFYFFANFQRIVIPGTVFDLLQHELHVSAPYITAFGAIFMYIYAFNQLVIGVLVDRFGGYRVMWGGGIILAIGAMLFPATSNLFIMYLSRALVGLGGSCFYLSLIRELKGWVSDKNFGIAISVMLFVGYAGGIAANAPFVFLTKFINWRELLFILGAIVFAGVILFSVLKTRIQLPAINKSVKMRILPFRLVLHKKHNRNLFSFACCNFGISYVIQAIIGKKFLEDFCLMSSSKAAMVLSIMAIVAASFNIINASVCKLCHNHRVRFLKNASIITFVSLLIICFCLLFNIRTGFIAFIFCVLAANASLTSLLVPVLHLTNRKMVSGTAVSIMNFCFFTMVGILGTAMGFLLNLFEPVKKGSVLVYSNHSYLAVFGLFFIISVFELYKAGKLSDKY